MKLLQKKYGQIKDTQIATLYIQYRQAKLEKREKFLNYEEFCNYYANDMGSKSVADYEKILTVCEPSKMIEDGV